MGLGCSLVEGGYVDAAAGLVAKGGIIIVGLLSTPDSENL
jgi:hypothetical protein